MRKIKRILKEDLQTIFLLIGMTFTVVTGFVFDLKIGLVTVSVLFFILAFVINAKNDNERR